VFFLCCAAYDYYVNFSHDNAAMVLVGFDLTQELLLILGLVIVNLGVLERFRCLIRLLLATLASGVIIVLICLAAPLLPGFHDAVRLIFQGISELAQAVLAPAGTAAPGSFVAELTEPAFLQGYFTAIISKGLLLGYFVILLMGWWGGSLIASRIMPFGQARSRVPRLAGFRMEGYYLWALIFFGALILLDRVVGIGIFSYAAWNVGLVILFLYGLQGMGILKFLFEKYRLPRLLWIVLLVALAIAMMSPQAYLIVIIALPAFGVSENWIRLRVPRNPEAEE
jgi:hypothetical protein